MNNNINKFEDSLNRIKGLLNNAKKQGHIVIRVEDLENIFPELKKSEDERIRKNCIHFLELQKQHHAATFEIEECIDWLEKQDQKETTQNKEDEENMNNEYDKDMLGAILYYIKNNRPLEKEHIAWLEKQESEPNWCHHKVDLSNCSEEYRKAYYDGWNNCNMQHSQCKSECNSKEYTFKAIPRLLEMILPTDRAKSYCQKLIDSLEQEGYSTDAKIVRDCLKQMNGEKVAMATMDEQKVANEDKLKFKVGDWVVVNNKHQSTYQVEKIEDGYYILRYTHGGTFRVCVLHDESLRLWTIEDARDGDVLATEDTVFIFKHTDKAGLSLCKSYCEVIGNSKLGFGFDFSINGVCPATKEQRDKLEKAMEEAGYEWDEMKMKLKEIEKEPENFKQQLMDEMTDLVKDYIQQKHAWSEDDEKIYNRIYDIVHSAAFSNCEVDEDGKEHGEYAKMADWLKSLKDRIQPQNTWKPSDEQILALRWILNNIPYNRHKEEISGLLEQIKKLREE